MINTGFSPVLNELILPTICGVNCTLMYSPVPMIHSFTQRFEKSTNLYEEDIVEHKLKIVNMTLNFQKEVQVSAVVYLADVPKASASNKAVIQ